MFKERMLQVLIECVVCIMQFFCFVSDHCNAYARLSDNMWLLKMSVFSFFVWNKIKYVGVIRYLRLRSAKTLAQNVLTQFS